MLLSKAEWDKEQLIRNLREEWGIVDEEPDEGDEDDENSDDAVVMRVGGMMLIVTLFLGHIPDNEAEINAENNYMWPEAVEVAKAHKAHIMVAVLGEEEKLLERGKLFTKAMAVCCKQKYATGVYTSGVVFEPRFYEGLADMLKEDELPIFNWVWFGLYRSEGGLNGYTYGMDVFGKEEMEVLNTDAEPEELRDFLASLASYVLACDVTLQDGETIGFSADDKHTITRSPGVGLPEDQMTLKISWESLAGGPDDDREDGPDGEAPQDEESSVPGVYTEEELAARSAMGVTSRGDIVLMICSASAFQAGVGAETVRDAMAGFGCAEAVELEGGAAACLFLDGERLLPSIGEYVPLSCVGLLR